MLFSNSGSETDINFSFITPLSSKFLKVIRVFL